MPRVQILAALFVLAGLGAAGRAYAQGDVALVTTGRDRAVAARAFESFVPISEGMQFELAPDEPPASVAWFVSVDTDLPVVRVWRRRDRVTLERRFDAPEDAYALAVVAAELLEVAQTDGDPASVGATVVEPAPVVPTPVEPEPIAIEPVEAEPIEPVVEPPPPLVEPTPESGWSVSFTPGLGVEAWVSPEGEPWIVQPTLFVELLVGPSNEAWRIGGAIFASALGAWSVEENEIDGRYARHDFGGRLSAGGDVGPIATRLLGHLRVGGAWVEGSATPEGRDEERGDAARPGWAIGLGVEARQPLIAGLEVFLDLGADALPAPVHFTAAGRTVVREPVVRLGGRLGLAWRLP